MSLTPYSWRILHPDAAVHYITDIRDADRFIQSLTGPVGLDLEWKPNRIKGAPENPVSLIQLANDRMILLLHISAMQGFPDNLRDFLEDASVVKAGVGIRCYFYLSHHSTFHSNVHADDAAKLYRDFCVSVRSCVDLSLMARSVDNARWKGKYGTSIGLARLVETYEGLVMAKGKISRSNWSSRLSILQQEYASNDAHAGFILHRRFLAMSEMMIKIPSPTCYTFHAVNGELLYQNGMLWHPFNPDYDPGPPPPKPPAPVKDKNSSSTTDKSNPPSSSSPPLEDPKEQVASTTGRGHNGGPLWRHSRKRTNAPSRPQSGTELRSESTAPDILSN